MLIYVRNEQEQTYNKNEKDSHLKVFFKKAAVQNSQEMHKLKSFFINVSSMGCNSTKKLTSLQAFSRKFFKYFKSSYSTDYLCCF